MSNWLYSSWSILITIIGVAVEQMDVKPTISLKSIVTSSWVLASIVSPEKIELQVKWLQNVRKYDMYSLKINILCLYEYVDNVG